MKLITSLLALLGVALGQNYCDDAYECDGVTVSTTYMYCYGYYACDEADITASYTYAYGFYSNYAGDVESSYIYAYGYRALYYADIVSYYVYAYGYQSIFYADLESRGSILYIYAYGYYAAYVADLLCYSGDSCRIHCGGSYGCYGTKFYCYSGATCYYDCSTDSVCPTLYSGVASDVSFEGDVKGTHHEGLTDDEIKAKRIENQHIKRKMIANKENDGALEGEDEAATNAREGTLAVDHAPSIINGAKFDNSMVIGGAAISVAFVFGILFGKYIKPSEYEKI